MKPKNKFRKYTIITGFAITAMHIYNKVLYRIATSDNLLYNKNEQYYNSRFGKIYYTKQGNGSPLLLIHDLNVSSSSYEWNKVVKRLSETNTVYTIDLLGCGRSEKPGITYTNYIYASLITEFIKNVIRSKTNIIATGYSSSIALTSCINDSSVIDKIILINPENMAVLSKFPNKFKNFSKNIINIPVIGTFIYNILVNKYTIEKDFRTRYFYNKNLIRKKDIITYFESLHKCNTKSKYLYSSIQIGYMDVNVKNSLTKIKNDIHIIVGNSNPENQLNADQYQNILSSIKITGINHTKHLPQLELPDEFINTIYDII